jgi:hypothetical protein
MRYAINALPTDRSARLAITIEGRGIDGKDFHIWLENDGESVVLRMNTLVDTLEGFTLKESKNFERRSYKTRTGESSERQVIYT